MALSSVVLPQPEGPTTTVISPAGTSKRAVVDGQHAGVLRAVDLDDVVDADAALAGCRRCYAAHAGIAAELAASTAASLTLLPPSASSRARHCIM